MNDDDLEIEMAFDQWRQNEACEHEDCILVHHYIGNSAKVSYLRDSLESRHEQLPIVYDKVIYSGIHCGDWLEIPVVQALLVELETVSAIHFPDKQDEERLRVFETQMRELARASLEVSKPISFELG